MLEVLEAAEVLGMLGMLDEVLGVLATGASVLGWKWILGDGCAQDAPALGLSRHNNWRKVDPAVDLVKGERSPSPTRGT